MKVKPLLTHAAVVNLLYEYYDGKRRGEELKAAVSHAWEAMRDDFNAYKTAHPTTWENWYIETETTKFDGLQWYLAGRWTTDYDILKFAARAPGKKTLDYGGGVGLTSIFLTLKGYEVTYVEKNLTSDIARFAMYVAKHFKVNDKIAWEIPETVRGPFDYIVSVDVLEHIPGWKIVVDRWLEMLAPKGVIYVTAPFELHCVDRPMHIDSKISVATYLYQKGFKRTHNLFYR